jgi:hypothetical protein
MLELATKLLAGGLIVWFALLAALIMVRVLRRDIRVEGMLATRAERIGQVDPERAVAMAVFPFVIAYYVIEGLNADMSVRASLPDIPQTLLVVLTGSNSLYLAGKIARGGGAS